MLRQIHVKDHLSPCPSVFLLLRSRSSAFFVVVGTRSDLSASSANPQMTKDVGDGQQFNLKKQGKRLVPKLSRRDGSKAQVSSFGRFKSSRGVIFTPQPESNGYVRVRINDKPRLIHRLMAIAFALTKRDDQDEVDHIDNNPSNNRLENLRWANRSEQTKHSFATNENRASGAQRQSKPVDGRKLGAEEWVTYTSSQGAAQQLGLHQGNISACCRGSCRQTGGYEFRYGEANEVAVLEGEVWMDVTI